MNFIRKLKLNKLGCYNFTLEESKNLEFINSLIKTKNINDISFFYSLYNLNTITKSTSTIRTIELYSSDENNYSYFLYFIDSHNLYWDHKVNDFLKSFTKNKTEIKRILRKIIKTYYINKIYFSKSVDLSKLIIK